MFTSVIALLAALTVMVSSAFLDASQNMQWGKFFQEQQTDQPRGDTDGARPSR
jgi:hypothetical protein